MNKQLVLILCFLQLSFWVEAQQLKANELCNDVNIALQDARLNYNPNLLAILPQNIGDSIIYDSFLLENTKLKCQVFTWEAWMGYTSLKKVKSNQYLVSYHTVIQWKNKDIPFVAIKSKLSIKNDSCKLVRLDSKIHLPFMVDSTSFNYILDTYTKLLDKYKKYLEEDSTYPEESKYYAAPETIELYSSLTYFAINGKTEAIELLRSFKFDFSQYISDYYYTGVKLLALSMADR